MTVNLTNGLAEPFSTYRELQEFLAQLDPPSPSHVRIFRGQTRDFGKMLASGMRGQALRSELTFHAYTRLLTEDLLNALPHATRPDEIDIWAFWVQAIAQHYGPGSRFLDVTHSLDVALWFALHETMGVKVLNVIGPPGPPDPERDIPVSDVWIRHRAWKDEPGWLYVFNVPKWTGDGSPGHGELLDLAEAPDIFASSERIKSQQACLLSADSKEHQGDLKSFYACPPIRVKWPPDGPPILMASTNAMFPTASQDDWYARFISVPVVPQLDSASKRLKFDHPLPVTFYDPEDPREQQVIGGLVSALTPRFVFTEALKSVGPGLPETGSEWWQSFRLSDATPILLESLFLFSTPPPDSDLWNQGLLSGDMSDEVEALDYASGAGSQVSLKNVFVEFSPLDHAGWERVEQSGGEVQMLRAVWLVRDGSGFAIQLFYYDYPSGGGYVAGPILIQFEPASAKLRYWSKQPNPGWVDLTQLTVAAKPLFVVLNILRELSPIMKAQAIPSLAAQSDDTRTFLVDVRGAGTHLVRATDSQSGRSWYVLRAIDADEPFVGAVKHGSALKVESKGPWSEFDAATIRRSVAQNLSVAQQ